MPYRLTNLTIKAVALVDDPDNPPAEVLLFKRRHDGPTISARLDRVEAAQSRLAALLGPPVEKTAEPITKSAVVALVASKVAALRAADPCTSEVELEARVWDANPELITKYREARF